MSLVVHVHLNQAPLSEDFKLVVSQQDIIHTTVQFKKLFKTSSLDKNIKGGDRIS